jgi:hypothetical protein
MWISFFTFSQVRKYNDTADSTLPAVPQKRKFNDDDDEEEVKPKIVKVEPEGKERMTFLSVFVILCTSLFVLLDYVLIPVFLLNIWLINLTSCDR